MNERTTEYIVRDILRKNNEKYEKIIIYEQKTDKP